MLRAALAASPPDVANRWVLSAPWRRSARGPSVALQVEWQSLAVMDDWACVAGRRLQARQPRPPAGLGWVGKCAMRAWSWLSSKAILLDRMLEVGRAGR